MNLKLETFISYPPHYHYRKVIPSEPDAQIFSSMEYLRHEVARNCNELVGSEYLVYRIEPHVMDSNQIDPEYVFLTKEMLKKTLIHFRIVTTKDKSNEPAMDQRS